MGGRAVYDPLMLQNRSSSAELAHANTEANVSGHCLDSGGSNMQNVGTGGNFSKSGGKWDLDFFCEMGMNLRLKHNLELS